VHYSVHQPRSPLAEFVANLWSLGDVPPHQRERIVASGTQELVINLHEDAFEIHDAPTGHCRRFSGAIVSGAYGGFFGIDTRAHASVIGVHFKPGGALPFLGLPPGTLADRHVDLETLWRAGARELRERLCAARTAPDRFRILEEALLARLRRPFEQHPAVPIAAHRLSEPGGSVGEVAAHVGLSRRRFIEVFTAQIGMTPKVFSRVRRFQRALALPRQDSGPGWSQVALACGYYDQSHMIRDFIAFSGFSPAELVQHLGPRLKPGHVAQPEGSNSSNTRALPRPRVPARRRQHDLTGNKA
jgi:AraC-like DNA-binding protein